MPANPEFPDLLFVWKSAQACLSYVRTLVPEESPGILVDLDAARFERALFPAVMEHLEEIVPRAVKAIDAVRHELVKAAGKTSPNGVVAVCGVPGASHCQVAVKLAQEVYARVHDAATQERGDNFYEVIDEEPGCLVGIRRSFEVETIDGYEVEVEELAKMDVFHEAVRFIDPLEVEQLQAKIEQEYVWACDNRQTYEGQVRHDSQMRDAIEALAREVGDLRVIIAERVKNNSDKTEQSEGADQVGNESQDEGGTGEIPGQRTGGESTGKKRVNLKCWAIGQHERGWHLFQLFPNKKKFCDKGNIDIPGGNQSVFAEELAKREGHISKEEAIALFRKRIPESDRPDWSEERIFVSKCKFTKARLVKTIRIAIARAAGCDAIDEDPLPWKHRRDAYQAKIHVGYAVPDDESWLTFRAFSDLSSDEKVDLGLH